jgi:hypothetical protein
MSTLCEESEFKNMVPFYARKVTNKEARVSTTSTYYAVPNEDDSESCYSRFQCTVLGVLHRQLRIHRGHFCYLLGWSKIAPLGSAFSNGPAPDDRHVCGVLVE